MSPNTNYRPCTAMLLFNVKGEVLVAERNDRKDTAWQLPQGGVDLDESIEQSALRELKEEIGTAAAEIIAIADDQICYDWPKKNNRKDHEKWRGQCVTLVALKFIGNDSDINVNTRCPEFRAWKWVPLEIIPQLIIPFKKPLYDYAVRQFTSIRDNSLLVKSR